MTEKAQEGRGVLFGIGCGRSGTSSLAALLNAQPATVCFHELNPSSMAWKGADLTITSLMRDFTSIINSEMRAVTADFVSPGRLKVFPRMHKLKRVNAIGDVASYYLPYVEEILLKWPQVRFPCLKRKKEEVIESFVAKLSKDTTKPPKNHWTFQNDQKWSYDPIWNKCFPKIKKINSESLVPYISEYYDEYYNLADSLANKHQNNIKIFDMTELNSEIGRKQILNFCLPGRRHRNVSVHENKTQELTQVLSSKA